MLTVREWVNKVHEITDRLEHQAGIELQKATSYHEGYVKACEDFGREMRQEILNKQEED